METVATPRTIAPLQKYSRTLLKSISSGDTGAWTLDWRHASAEAYLLHFYFVNRLYGCSNNFSDIIVMLQYTSINMVVRFSHLQYFDILFETVGIERRFQKESS